MVFLFIPHFVFSSDLLQTNYIKYLSEKYKVVVFSPIFKLNSASGYYQSPNVKYIAWDAEHPNLWLLFNKTLRLALIREFDNLEYHKLREKTQLNMNWQRKFLKFVAKLIPKPFTRADFFTWLENFLLPNSKVFKKYLDEYKPSLLITATPGFNGVEAEAILLARRNGLKTVATNFSWDNLFNTAKQIRKTDYLITWNSMVKKAALEIHDYSEKNVFVSGVIRFDHHFSGKSKNEKERKEFLAEKGLDPSLQTILYTTVPPQIYPFQVEFLDNLIRLRGAGTLGQNFNVIVRLHPRDDFQYYEKFLNLKNVHVENAGKLKSLRGAQLHKVEMDIEDLDNLRKTFLYSDLAVNFRSSITLETSIYDLPTINLAYNGYELYYQMDHYIPILERGVVRLAHDEEEFVKIAKDYLKNPSLDSENRAKLAQEYVPFQDGFSYKRAVDFLDLILKN